MQGQAGSGSPEQFFTVDLVQVFQAHGSAREGSLPVIMQAPSWLSQALWEHAYSA